MRNFHRREIDKVFNKLMLDGVMDKNGQEYSEKFMIFGTPADALGEILGRVPEQLLDLFLEGHAEKKHHSKSRDEKEAAVNHRICRSFGEEVYDLDFDEMETILRVMDKQPLTGTNVRILTEYLIWRGWAFMFCEGGSIHFVIPKECQEMVRALYANKDTKVVFRFVNVVRLTLWACLNLYGVIEADKVCDFASHIFLKSLPTKQRQEIAVSLWEQVEETLHILVEQDKTAWYDDKYIISSDLENRREYRQILKSAGKREYFEPSEDDIKIYSVNMVDVGNPYYQAMVREIKCLCHDTRRADNLMYEIEYKAVEKNFGMGEIVELLRIYGIQCPSGRTDHFIKSCGHWLCTVRRWSNRGFSDEELGKAEHGISRKYLSGGRKPLFAHKAPVGMKEKM